MTKILRGAEVAEAMHEDILLRVESLKDKGITPCLAIVRVGERADDIAYENSAKKRCEKLGVAVRCFLLPEAASQAELLSLIGTVNADCAIHGCLLLRPLPKWFDDEAIRNALSPEKDVDGIADGSLAGVFSGAGKAFAPCTAQACMEILAHFKIDLTGKRAVVLGRSLTVGKPAAMMLLAQNATVTICHTRTVNLPAVCREAEVLLVAVGCRGLIGKEYLSQGQTVIDVGIHVDEDGGLCGDVVFAEAEGLVGAITPVPGGVGTVTTTVLAKHVVEAAERAAEAPR